MLMKYTSYLPVPHGGDNNNLHIYTRHKVVTQVETRPYNNNNNNMQYCSIVILPLNRNFRVGAISDYIQRVADSDHRCLRSSSSLH